MNTSLIVGLLLLSAVAYADEDLSGCYAVQLGPLTSGAPNSVVNQGLDAKAIRLTHDPTQAPWGTGKGWLVLPAKSSERFSYATAYWVGDGREVVITWSNNGLSGYRVMVRPVGGRLEGTAANFWDFKPHITNERRVVLERISCQSA